jgi:hypothetical protein
MQFTNSQLQTFRNAMLAETDPVFVALRTAGATGQMADWLNGAAVPAHTVWSTSVPVSAILDAIAFNSYTPVPAADGTAAFTNRVLAIQTKQMNLQNMLIGRERIDASRQRIRSGLLDAVIDLPAGTNGNLVSAGGPGGDRVMNALTRPATRFERIFAVNSATTGNITAFLLNLEGAVSDADVVLALNS